MRRAKDSVLFVTGARGSGKSSMLLEHAREFDRVLVWSPLESTDNYARKLGIPRVDSLSDFLGVASGFDDESRSSVVYAPAFPSPKIFDMFCKLCWNLGHALVLVDELAAVTPIGKALGWWGRVVREGRHRGLDVAAGAQRPAEVDKTIISNTTRIVCFRLARITDRKLMADELSVERGSIDSLRPLQFLECDRLTGHVERGKIAFS